MIKRTACIIALLLVFLLAGCGGSAAAEDPAGGETPPEAPPIDAPSETMSDIFSGEELPQEKIEELQSRCSALALLYRDVYIAAEKTPSPYWGVGDEVSQEVVNEIEELLIKEGYPVLNSSRDLPAFLEHPQGFFDFWERAQNGEDAVTSLWSVSSSGGLSYSEFQYIDGKAYHLFASAAWNEDGELLVSGCGRRPVLHWDMTYRGDFYYQDIPKNMHWTATTLLRLKPVEERLYRLAQRYIEPVSYYHVNIFLGDWDAEDHGELCLNDLFDALYRMKTGDYLHPDDFQRVDGDSLYYLIPAELFEDTVLPFFQLPLSQLRELAMYDPQTDAYPWQDVTNYNVSYFPLILPEVTEAVENPDGSVTLKVRALCLDLWTDSLFLHEVTVRPAENGGFQYLGNRITWRSGLELPSAQPRMSAWRAETIG